jgi:predicted dehydrogenase
LTKEKLRVGVIGLGKMGLLHAGILNTLPEVQLAGLCDKNRLVIRFFRNMFRGAQIVSDLKMLLHLNLDVVYVTTPIPSHASVAKIMYSEGNSCNLFIEKTLAANYEEAKVLCERVNRFGGFNMVGYMKRFAVTFNKAKDLLNRETLGELTCFEAYAYSSDFLRTEKSQKASSSRGGVLSDLGSHIIDLALWFFGDLEVTSSKIESFNEAGVDDAVCFLVEKGNNLEGKFDISWCKEHYRLPEFGLSVEGSKGRIDVNDYEVRLKLKNGESGRWLRQDLNDNVDFLLGDPEYFREDLYFMTSILRSREPEPSFRTASRVDSIIEQVRSRSDKDEK